VNNQHQVSDASHQIALEFWSSKVRLTAVEFGSFTRLADRRLAGSPGAAVACK
jgi:hypothetical protein